MTKPLQRYGKRLKTHTIEYMINLYEPWTAKIKTKKTNNIGIYNRVGELVATLHVHKQASKETISRRMKEAQIIAEAPSSIRNTKSV